jgi:hypothetical protein
LLSLPAISGGAQLALALKHFFTRASTEAKAEVSGRNPKHISWMQFVYNLGVCLLVRLQRGGLESVGVEDEGLQAKLEQINQLLARERETERETVVGVVLAEIVDVIAADVRDAVVGTEVVVVSEETALEVRLKDTLTLTQGSVMQVSDPVGEIAFAKVVFVLGGNNCNYNL